MPPKAGGESNAWKNFKQQKMHVWQPLLTPTAVIGTLLVGGIVFVILGAIALGMSNAIVEQRIGPYESGPTHQVLPVIIEETMKAPVFFYYEVSNYYQNHRFYVKSRSDGQLAGDTSAKTATCDPMERNGTGYTYYPCGLVATSTFSDTFHMCEGNGTAGCGGRSLSGWTEEGIAWDSDKDTKFQARAPRSDETTVGPRGPLPNINDEHFMVWMRTAGKPRFYKLYAIINADLTKGQQLTIDLNNTYSVAGFGGTKAILLSTMNGLGGKNTFLGAASLLLGFLFILTALAFFAKHRLNPRKLGDLSYFGWSGGLATAAASSPAPLSLVRSTTPLSVDATEAAAEASRQPYEAADF